MISVNFCFLLAFVSQTLGYLHTHQSQSSVITHLESLLCSADVMSSSHIMPFMLLDECGMNIKDCLSFNSTFLHQFLKEISSPAASKYSTRFTRYNL